MSMQLRALDLFPFPFHSVLDPCYIFFLFTRLLEKIFVFKNNTTCIKIWFVSVN